MRSPVPPLLLPLMWILTGCSAAYHSEQGQTALREHRLSDAERHFRSALAKDATGTGQLIGLGWTYHLAGERIAARQVFERCVELAPTDPDCLRGLASISLAEGESTTSRSLLARALRHDPDHPGVLSSMALLEMSSGSVDAGAARYELLVEQFPDRAEHLLGLAEARLRQKRPLESLELIEKALSLADTPIRYRAMLWQLQARCLVNASAGREDPDRCAETAPPVMQWLDAADRAVEMAEQTGVVLPDLPRVRRLVLRRRGVVEDACPPARFKLAVPPSSPGADHE